ncbi:growth factor receptor-bound protein 14-like isoform X3 [Actinia tenebrosa]|nr:growth factor receptor-bound protein 14-like isoform X3 [Actinia tenebrosa]
MLEELLADCDVLDHDDSKPLIDTNRHMEILQEQGAALSNDEWMTSPPKDSNESKDVNDNEGAKSADETKEPQSAGGTSVQIFNEDHSCMTVSVGQNMSAVECCHKLVLLNTFKEDPNWVIAEHVTDLGIERVVEDHERILEVYQHWAPNSNNKFLFRKDHKKYDFFINTAEYFPSHLLDDDSSDRAVTEQAERAKQILLQKLFRQCTQVPEIASMLYIKDFSKKSWSKKYLILRGSGLYSSTKGKSRAFKDLQSFVQFDGCALYYLLNSTKIHKSPTPYGFCLVPLKAKELKEIKCFCCEDEKSFLSWMTGIRLAKLGSQLRNNYDDMIRKFAKLAKLSSSVTIPPKPAKVHETVLRSRSQTTAACLVREDRVAMDFTGRYGKIVTNTKEIEELSNARPPKRLSRRLYGSLFIQSSQSVDSDIDEEPWFHGLVSREQTLKTMKEEGLENGLFLVRKSCTANDVFVLSFCMNKKVYHCQMVQDIGNGNEMCFSLDKGPAFPCVADLIEYYKQKPINGLSVALRRPCKKRRNSLTTTEPARASSAES